MELKGSKTEKNLQAAFAGESQAHTMQVLQKKPATNRFPRTLTKHLITKENMLKSGSNFSMTVCSI